MNLNIILFAIFIGIGFLIYDYFCKYKASGSIYSSFNGDNIGKNLYSSSTYKMNQSTPRIAVKPLPSYRSNDNPKFPVVETPIHKTRTVIINCNQEMPQPKIDHIDWGSDFTPNLSSRFNN